MGRSVNLLMRFRCNVSPYTRFEHVWTWRVLGKSTLIFAINHSERSRFSFGILWNPRLGSNVPTIPPIRVKTKKKLPAYIVYIHFFLITKQVSVSSKSALPRRRQQTRPPCLVHCNLHQIYTVQRNYTLPMKIL